MPTDDVTFQLNATTPQLILDIGTHKVLGLAVYPTADGIDVRAASLRTHGARAMRDGQVHDVPAVAKTVRRVVDDIERTVGTTFTRACIAAAGRALHTARGRAERTEQRPVRFSADMLRALTWDAVADAQANLLAELPLEEHVKGFYCIAHSRTANRVDGQPIGSLVDQRGSRFTVEVLATFLPGVVVDSLQAVLAAANLEAEGLTLEPVAALEAVVPETMRHLNLMLVDMGAGTTDIAYTGDGTIQAFAMVPMGGDAVTEALATELLLDFTVAEQAKRQASRGDVATVHNVIGERVVIDPKLLHDTIGATADRLAEAVFAATADWNVDAKPEAILLIGGGSRTPGFAAALADKLQLPPNRVAVRDRSAVRGVKGSEHLQGPDTVTALGIALRFVDDKEMPPVRVQVNGHPVSLFQPERCTVREAARIAGIPLEQIVSRLGKGMTVTVNDGLLTIPGRRGRQGTVRVNGEAATLDTELHSNDYVELTLPDAGDDAHLNVGQLIALWHERRRREAGEAAPRIQFNDEWIQLPVTAHREGQLVSDDDPVRDRDQFVFSQPRTVSELLTALGHDDVTRPFRIVLNGEPTTFQLKAELRLNGSPASPGDRINDGDRLDAASPGSLPLYELLSYSQFDTFRLAAGDDGARSASSVPDAVRATPSDPEPIRSTPGDPEPIRSTPSPASGPHSRRPRTLTYYVRGEKAGFTTIVNDGDEVQIGYE